MNKKRKTREMRSILLLIVGFLFSQTFFIQVSYAQVDMSEKEKIEKNRETQRQQDALRDSALTPNAKPTESKTINFQDNTGASFEVDHSALTYSSVYEADNTIQGIKFSGAFSAAFYSEQKKDKKYRILAGIELPIDFEMPLQRLVPFAGGGIQIGSGLSLYANGGFDIRIAKWFKIQTGLNFDSSHGSGFLLGAGLTW